MPKKRTYEPGQKYHGNGTDRVHISAAIPLTTRRLLEAESERSGKSLSKVIVAALDSYTLSANTEKAGTL